MTTVHGAIITPAGGRAENATVVVALVDQAGRPVPGWNAATDTEVLGVVVVPVDVDGSWSTMLTPNASVTSATGPTLYQVTERARTGPGASYFISVPDTGSHWAGDLQVPLPGQAAPEQLAGYLPLAGGTLTGPLLLAGDPAAALQAATRQYVDALRPRARSSYITSGDRQYPDTSGVWQLLADFPTLSVPAVVGEWVELAITGMTAPAADSLTDIAIVVDGVPARYLSSGESTPAFEGEPSLHPFPGSFHGLGYSKGWTITASDLDDGAVTVAVAVKSGGAGTLYASTLWPWYWRLLNLRTVS
ncbi:hypothetical protein [Nonomuraea dietziae]|uniref:hypothetical protein n=1 Tax=Nonomuraea dietziae TaxID=65515 RepID=UPI0034310C36